MTRRSAVSRRIIDTARRWRAAPDRWSVSLTTKMFVLVVIAVMPALAIQSFNEYDLRKSRENDIRNQTVQITMQFGEEMGEIREGARQYLQVISQLPAINSLDAEGCTRLLRTLNAKTPYYGLLGVADALGEVRCASGPTSLSSVADLPFFKRALAQADMAVGNYWADPTSGEKRIHFGLKFSDEQDNVIGVVFAGLDLNWLSEHLKNRGLSPTQSILIADREGNIIARLPHPEQLVGKNMRQGHAGIMDGDTTGWEESKGVDGVERIFGYVPPALPPRDLFLSAGQSKAEAFAAIDYVTRRGILLILLGLLTAMYAAWIGGRTFIKRPVQALLEVTHEWRNGNYAARSHFKGQGSEIDLLSTSFNEMAEAVASRHAAQLQAEDRLQELNATLEERVEERTRELVAANRAKSQFLANMSHELRTPMNGVLGMVELLLQTQLEPKQQMHVRTAQRSAETMLALVTSILDLSRIEAGKFELEHKSFDLRTLLDDVVSMLGPTASQKGLYLSLLRPSDMMTALIGDSVRLTQILSNLVGNAIKFTDHGDVTISTVLKEATGDLVVIEFEVRDTGIGISDDDQTIIFNAFTQADSTDTRRFSGSGLGLSICKDLSELMGGTIEVTSQLGVGSSFRFTARFGRQADGTPPRPRGDDLCCPPKPHHAQLVESTDTVRLEQENLLKQDGLRVAAAGVSAGSLPVAATATARDGLRAAPLPAVAGPDQPASIADPPSIALSDRNHALVVEDNAINLVVAVGILESLGWSIETARDGLEALAAHARRHFDVILMDCQMPKMDGFGATVAIRTREAIGAIHTPIIALTASAEGGFRERCLAAGMDEYVTKPFSRLQIKAALTKVVAERCVS
jgi:signal transduction histidine kinase/CheY-like chemotaxis protein